MASRKALRRGQGLQGARGSGVRTAAARISVQQQSIMEQISVLRMQISVNSDNTSKVVQVGEKHRLELELERIKNVVR